MSADASQDQEVRFFSRRFLLNRYWVGFVFTATLTLLLYRLVLNVSLARGILELETSQLSGQQIWGSWAGSWSGLVVLVVCSALIYPWAYLLEWFRVAKPHRIQGTTLVLVACCYFFLILITLCAATHFLLLKELSTGFRFGILANGLQHLSARGLMTLAGPAPIAGLLLPLILFHLVSRVRTRRLLAWTGWIWGARLGLTVLGGIISWTTDSSAQPEIAHSPIFYLCEDALRTRKGARLLPGLPSANEAVSRSQWAAMRLVDPRFVGEPQPPVARRPSETPAAGRTNWNVVVLILESTGADYVFEPYKDYGIPMPYLQQIASRGLHLRNHFSTSNTSVISLFSFFTGLYPCIPEWRAICEAPAMNKYLGSDYSTFLVHPTSSGFYFPIELLENNRFTPLYTFENIPANGRPDVWNSARNELSSVDFFLSRMDHSSGPFLGVYWSFVPHFPYSDYGPEYRMVPKPQNDRERYLNNLRLLDSQIERIVKHLEEKKLMDHTILVVLGDHGEAFGQHRGIQKHSIGTYSESYRAPVILYQPQLFAPAVSDRLTSHVDLLPTLLDAMGRRFDPSLFQGESLFSPLTRKYLFLQSGIGSYVSILNSEAKVSVSYELQESYAFNLERNPGETVRLRAEAFPEMYADLLAFQAFQEKALPQYARTHRTQAQAAFIPPRSQ